MKNKITCRCGNQFEFDSWYDYNRSWYDPSSPNYNKHHINLKCCNIVIESKIAESSIPICLKDKYFIYSLNLNNYGRVLALEYKEDNYINYPNAIFICQQSSLIKEFDDNELDTAQKQFDALYDLYENLIFL